MTEKQWLKATDPAEMLELLGPHASDRKLRLFACACCRRVWHIVTSPKLEQALPLLEDSIEGKAKDRGRAHKLAGEMLTDGSSTQACIGAELWKASQKAFKRDEYGFYRIGYSVQAALGWAAGGFHPVFTNAVKAERKEQAKVVREMFGSPFRPVHFSPQWRTSDVLTLARQMYDSRDFGAMPILADALQEAGCDSEDLLGHLRDPHVVHVRGCWALDLVLGKE
jgi:hypothetical protein